MQSMEEKKAFNDVVYRTCIVSDLLYLVIHIVYLLLFLLTKLYILVYLNIGSIMVYLLCLLLIRYKKYIVYTFICGIEIAAYMSTCSIMCGFDSGFQLCLIGLCIIAFYANYFAEHGKKLYIPICWSAMMLILYLFLFFYCQNHKPYYDMKEWLLSFLRVAHASVVFAFIAGFLYIFIKYVVGLEEITKQESRTDRLTHIPNRYALYNYLESLKDKEDYVLAIFDIDDFKKINDVNGHICGDYMLREIANIAYGNSSDGFVARYGGEEFIVILRYEEDLITTADKLDKIRRIIADYDFTFDNKTLHLTITVGIAKYISGTTIDEWITRADDKLYEGKRTGKNKTVI